MKFTIYITNDPFFLVRSWKFVVTDFGERRATGWRTTRARADRAAKRAARRLARQGPNRFTYEVPEVAK